LLILDDDVYDGSTLTVDKDDVSAAETSHCSDSVVRRDRRRSNLLKIMYISCTVCRKVVHRGSRARHMRLHTRETSYACELCKKRFNYPLTATVAIWVEL